MSQLQRRNSELVDLLSADFINGWIPLDQVVVRDRLAMVTFGNIAQEFRSLVLSAQVSTTAAGEADVLRLRFNGDFDNTYHYIEAGFLCDATIDVICERAVTSLRVGDCQGGGGAPDAFSPLVLAMPGYSRPDRTKWGTLLQSGSMGDLSVDADLRITLARGLWQRTEPVTDISIFAETGPNFGIGSVFELFGIL